MVDWKLMFVVPAAEGRKTRTVLACAMSLALSGCAPTALMPSFRHPLHFDSSSSPVPLPREACLGTADSTVDFQNGDGMLYIVSSFGKIEKDDDEMEEIRREFRKESERGAIVTPKLFIEYSEKISDVKYSREIDPLIIDQMVEWRQENFVQQSNKDRCWAAVLSMLTKHIGISLSQDEMLGALKLSCPDKINDEATSNQMIHALVRAHSGQILWPYKLGEEGDGITSMREVVTPIPLIVPPFVGFLSVRIGQPPSKPLILRSKENPDVADGYILPIRNSHTLVKAFNENLPVAMGYVSNGARHMVLAVGASYRPGGLVESNSDNRFGDVTSPKIENIFVIDPQSEGGISTLRGSVLDDVKIAFIISPTRKFSNIE